jgi:hypothetical protein
VPSAHHRPPHARQVLVEHPPTSCCSPAS